MIKVADGIALIEINETGEARLKEENGLQWLDFRLENVCFDDAEGTEQLHSQLPDDLKDVLILVTFDYVCNCSHTWDGDYDCEEYFNIVSYTVMKENYKEFYREMVTEELNIVNNIYGSLDNIPKDDLIHNRDYYRDLVADWEEFYDEDFIPYKKERKKINIEDLVK